jgi:hypothetical protein
MYVDFVLHFVCNDKITRTLFENLYHKRAAVLAKTRIVVCKIEILSLVLVSVLADETFTTVTVPFQPPHRLWLGQE